MTNELREACERMSSIKYSRNHNGEMEARCGNYSLTFDSEDESALRRWLAENPEPTKTPSRKFAERIIEKPEILDGIIEAVASDEPAEEWPVEPSSSGGVAGEEEQIAGPCSYCGHANHWRPDCPVIAMEHWRRVATTQAAEIAELKGMEGTIAALKIEVSRLNNSYLRAMESLRAVEIERDNLKHPKLESERAE